MVDKVNGRVQGGEFLGKQLDFYVAEFTADLNTVAANAGDEARAAAAHKRRERVVETVALQGQPIIMNDLVSAANTNAVSFKFAIEHADSWKTNASGSLGSKLNAGVASLTAALDSIPGVDAVTVTVADKLS